MMEMKAMIFAAGLGTRLQPITNNCPKALIKLNGKPLIWYAVNKLIGCGVTQIVVNIHHFGEQIIDYFKENCFNVPIFFSDERDFLLDTGGGLSKAREYLQDSSTIIAYNADIISAVDLKKVIEFHQQHQPLATLVVRHRETSRYLHFDDEMHLSGWKNIETGEEKISTQKFYTSNKFAFSGIQVLSPELFDLITETGKFSVVDLYLRLAKEHAIKGFLDQSEYWLDLGKQGQIEAAEKLLSQH